MAADVPFENKTITRNQPLFGIGMEYKMGSTNVYANITQATGLYCSLI
jgi:Fe(3+) dicitrate transport protein